MRRTGKCLCGAVTFEADVAPHFHACHCDMCRRWSGSPLMAAMAGPDVAFRGGEVRRYRSSKIAERGFCPTCGSHLFYFSIPAKVFVLPVGLFDDQSGLGMTGEIYVDEQPESYAFAGAHERMTGAEFVASVTGGKKD